MGIRRQSQRIASDAEQAFGHRTSRGTRRARGPAARFVSGLAAVALAVAGLVVAAASPASAAVTTTVQEVPGTTGLGFVTCYDATTCIAVGGLGFGGVPPQGVVVPITNGVAGPAQVVPGTYTLYGAACSTATTCFAVGLVGSPGTFQAVFVPITDGVAGAAQVVPGPFSLNGIDCVSATTCVAAGADSVVVITNGVPGPAQPVPGLNPAFFSLSCASATTCYAVGWVDAPDFSGNTLGLLVPIVNGVPGAPQTVAGTASLDAIDCPTATTCQAVGTRSNFSGSVLVPIVNGTPGALTPLPGLLAIGISCTGADTCTAVGYSGPTGLVVPIVDGNPGPAQTVAGVLRIDGVACPTATTCYAGSGAGSFPDLVGALVTITHVPGGTSLTCTTRTNNAGTLIAVCTVSDPDGIRAVQIVNTTTGQRLGGMAFDCSDAPTSATVRVPAGSRYRVVVTDCNTPRVKTTFVIRANGSVNQV